MNYIAVFLFALIVYIFPQYTSAVAVGINYTSSSILPEIATGPRNNTRLQTIYSMSLSKDFILQAPGIRNLNQDESGAGDIPTGVNLLAYNYDTTGSYSYFKGDWGTPPMDGTWYSDRTWLWGGWVVVQNYFRGGITTQLGYNLTSSNNSIIDCASSGGTSCRTVGQGTATITVSFPGTGSYYVQRLYALGTVPTIYEPANCPIITDYRADSNGDYYEIYYRVCTCDNPNSYLEPPTVDGDGNRTDLMEIQTCSRYDTNENSAFTPSGYAGSETSAHNYTLNSLTYTIRVQNPNQAPTVSYTGTTGIGYNTATANWSYSDVDGDPQVWSHVQIATDSGFGNIIASPSQNSSATNMSISGLIPGTTYYPRVRVYNAVNGWTGYVNGPAFTTLANNPPNLGEFSCSGTATGYTSARVNWDYTGSDPDQLELSLKYIKAGDPAWTSVNLPGNRTGAQNIASLIPGETYAVRIEVLDQYNRHLRNNWAVAWKDCGNVTATPYPEPVVDFNLTGGGNTAGPGGTLTINTGDSIRTNWTITNTDGLQDNSCALSTTGVRSIFNESSLGFGPDSRQNNSLAADPNDQNYVVRLQCAGRTPANPVRNIDRTINVTIRTRPVISCSIPNTVVSAENPTVNIIGNVSNATGPYSWGIRREGSGVYTPLGDTGNNITPILDYTGLAFGKYTPWLQVRASNGRIAEAACTGVTNLADRNIREIAP
jgi:hypothetical protein